MIKALIFDFAGVIGIDGYSVWAKEKKAMGIESKTSYFNDISNQVDSGVITNKKFISIISKKLGVDKNLIKKEVFEKIKINYELLDLILKLKKKYKIGLLTNFTHEWINELFELYKLEKYFDSKVISSLHKVIKPDIKIYRISLSLLKIKPEEAIFFDDRQKNVNGGESAGIKSLLFTTNQQFIKNLTNYGIVIPS